MAAEVHVGDIGTIFELTFLDENNAIVDISGASVKQAIFRQPNGVVVTKALQFSTSGTDGKARYVALSGDLNVSGYWEVQGYVSLSSGNYHSDTFKFPVLENLG